MRTSALGLAVLLLALAAPAAAQELRLVRAVVHVHTDLSTGDLSLDEIVQRAESQGIEAVFLAENFLLRVDYGVFPFRALTRVRREEPSVLARGLDQYLAAVAEARQRHPGTLIVPGVEVMVHYWWSGSPFAGELTVHDLQKNILALGLSTPAALRALPASGSPATARYSAQSLLDLLPALLLVPGLVLLRPRRPRVALGRGRPDPRESWRRTLGGLLCAIGAVALVRGFPFTTGAFSPYRDLGTAPYQELIDAIEQHGGAAVWSFPDAFDLGEQRVYGLRVTRQTEPYGDDLLRTFRYSAFGGVYEDTTRFPQLGGGWDYLLGQYARGERSRPGWLIGESGSPARPDVRRAADGPDERAGARPVRRHHARRHGPLRRHRERRAVDARRGPRGDPHERRLRAGAAGDADQERRHRAHVDGHDAAQRGRPGGLRRHAGLLPPRRARAEDRIHPVQPHLHPLMRGASSAFWVRGGVTVNRRP
ncbi:MAG: hypothetical protein HY217_10830 [Candidatus Rokubacteria bacterium]|nr:hypothetical protein [Candidatus Rokubacteria bacterium]